MNSELCRKALEKVGNPNILVNLVSRRVRQLNSAGPAARPLIAGAENMSAADIALMEIIEGKINWVVVDESDHDKPHSTQSRHNPG